MYNFFSFRFLLRTLSVAAPFSLIYLVSVYQVRR